MTTPIEILDSLTPLEQKKCREMIHDCGYTVHAALYERGHIEEAPNPARSYSKGDRVRDIHTGVEYVVKENIGWQRYAGRGDWTIALESIDPSQPTPWNKSRNLEPVAK